jgi:hypothetical protein
MQIPNNDFLSYRDNFTKYHLKIDIELLLTTITQVNSEIKVAQCRFLDNPGTIKPEKKGKCLEIVKMNLKIIGKKHCFTKYPGQLAICQEDYVKVFM